MNLQFPNCTVDTSRQSITFHGNPPFFYVVGSDGITWLPASESTKILGYKKGRNLVLTQVPEEQVETFSSLKERGAKLPIAKDLRGHKKYITENAFIALIIMSQLPQAKLLKSWVIDHLRPSKSALASPNRPKKPLDPSDPIFLLRTLTRV